MCVNKVILNWLLRRATDSLYYWGVLQRTHCSDDRATPASEHDLPQMTASSGSALSIRVPIDLMAGFMG